MMLPPAEVAPKLVPTTETKLGVKVPTTEGETEVTAGARKVKETELLDLLALLMTVKLDTPPAGGSIDGTVILIWVFVHETKELITTGEVREVKVTVPAVLPNSLPRMVMVICPLVCPDDGFTLAS